MGRRDELNALFDALYEKHARRVHAFLLGRTGNDDVAADLLQDTFVRTWRHLDELREMCREAGLSMRGAKKELAAKLIAKGVV